MIPIRVKCAASNFTLGRPRGMQPEAIVLHRTGGTLEQIKTWFLDGSKGMSAHYAVTKSGGVVHFVEERDTAFHAGLAINSTWKGLKPRVNPNFYTIGIELEGSAVDAVPDEQAEACAELMAGIAIRYDIRIDNDRIVLHSEIRPSRNCPGAAFSRGDLVQRTLLAAVSSEICPASGEVEVLRDTNLREAVPSSSARIVSVLRGGARVWVNGFTLRGEAVNGNAAWYRHEDGNFFWAGNSAVSQPRPVPAHDEADVVRSINSGSITVEKACGFPVTNTSSSRLGIAEIDQFFINSSSAPLELAKADRDAVGTIQDLLAGHGFNGLPSSLSPTYGTFGDLTQAPLSEFQKSCGLPPGAAVTADTMKQLVGIPARDPRATPAYFCLVLGIPFTAMNRILTLTAQMEGRGRFAALNLNTDSAGLSFGLIQWAQRPGRLLDIVSAFRHADPEAFVRLLGNGNPDLADRLISHLKKPFSGLIQSSGISTDHGLDLIASPWADRFRQAALYPEFQKAQVNTARKAFEASLTCLREYDNAGLIRSERGVAFMLDVANQFGIGRAQRLPATADHGLAGIYRKVFRPGMSEHELLQAIADATVAAMPPRFQVGVRSRRNLFLSTPLLSDSNTLESAYSGVTSGSGKGNG